jgi:CheY-like chemotaxis protein
VASYTTKPADLDTLAQVFAEVTAQVARPIHVLLLIENNLEKRHVIMEALAGPDRMFDAVPSAAEALQALHTKQYQGVVVELDLPDEDGMALLQQIRGDPALADIPAVLYSARALDAATLERDRELDAAVMGEGGSPLARLTPELAGFLQQVKQALPKTPAPDETPVACAQLAGKRVLIVDDDARNLFALTGLLESYEMNVVAVETGQEALKQLDTNPAIDIVLMDIMMPDMDGYETMRRLRADARFAKLPIIALTAKAMLEDRTKCLAAGASDYASKPVDTEQLLAQLCVWLGEPAKAAGAD